MNKFLPLVISTSLLFSGCASIVEGSSQIVSVKTVSKDQDVQDAFCQMDNGKGTFFVKTPGTTKIQKANAPLNIKCEKTGFQPGTAVVESFTKAMAFGNILFGGFIGAGVDMATGAAYVYPDLITVLMGENIKISGEESAKQLKDKQDQENLKKVQ